jgi:hypothetical protein
MRGSEEAEQSKAVGGREKRSDILGGRSCEMQ